MALTVERVTTLQMCEADVKNQWVTYTINWRNITRTTNVPITKTPTGHASYAMNPREAVSDTEDRSIQKVGMREDKEKKTYEPYMSRERHYEQQYQQPVGRRLGGKTGTHNEGLQVHPIIADQEPHVTDDPKTTCSAASGNNFVSVGVDFEDGVRGYRKHRNVHTGCHC